MELPTHPDADDTGAAPQGDSRQRSLGATVALGTIAAIVIIVIVLHLTGVVGPLSK